MNKRTQQIIFVVETSDSSSAKINVINHKMQLIINSLVQNEESDFDFEIALLSFSDTAKWMHRKFFIANDFVFNPLESGGKRNIEIVVHELITMLEKTSAKENMLKFPPIICFVLAEKILFENETFSKLIGNYLFRHSKKIIVPVYENQNFFDNCDSDFSLAFLNYFIDEIEKQHSEHNAVSLNDFSTENINGILKVHKDTKASWQQIWKEAIDANSTLIRDRKTGEEKFERLLKKYGEDGMVFFEWGIAYDTIKDYKMALKKLKIAKQRLPLAHWQERAQYGMEKIQGKFSKEYDITTTAMYDLHPFLYSPNEQELKYLLISSIPKIKTETVSVLIFFRMAIEIFIDVIMEKFQFARDKDLVNNIDTICSLYQFSSLKGSMHRIRRAGNAKIHSNSNIEDIKLANDINGRINDFMEIVRFYKSESEVSKLCHQ